ncbi:hypothetical protein G7Z17_g4151 [Cylindrodendrum hubeiense]|uniref:Uncharacterized protein n=1 Tax=Cylindrodendrum hubeiense TaxID=595255 RepID=A0A9P5H9F4_9HYPO|nr:hypothetical protein G7Z17_g4151 [Cylindrodendrum hubeiense]
MWDYGIPEATGSEECSSGLSLDRFYAEFRGRRSDNFFEFGPTHEDQAIGTEYPMDWLVEDTQPGTVPTFEELKKIKETIENGKKKLSSFAIKASSPPNSAASSRSSSSTRK